MEPKLVIDEKEEHSLPLKKRRLSNDDVSPSPPNSIGDLSSEYTIIDSKSFTSEDYVITSKKWKQILAAEEEAMVRRESISRQIELQLIKLESELSTIDQKLQMEVDKINATVDTGEDNNYQLKKHLERSDEYSDDESTNDLPSFRGNPLEWPRFKEAFEWTTETCNYTEEQNMDRLLSSLQGKARESLAGLLKTDMKASQLMDILQWRYGHPNALFQCVMRKIKSTPKIKANNVDLVSFASTVQEAVATINVADPVYLHSVDLFEEILSKFPYSLVLQFNRFRFERSLDEPRVMSLTNFLVKEAAMACRVGVFESTDATANNAEEDTMSCIYCNRHQSGPLTSCRFFLKAHPRKRFDWAFRHRLCFLCLSNKHQARYCWRPQEGNCTIDGCRLKHHPLLHLGHEQNGQYESHRA